MTAEDIAETLGMARSNVSNSIRELLSWGLIRRAPILGDRRDHFEAETDIWEVAAERRPPQGAGDRPRRGCIARLRDRCRRRSDDQPGCEQTAEGNAGFHRTGRSLVLANADVPRPRLVALMSWAKRSSVSCRGKPNKASGGGAYHGVSEAKFRTSVPADSEQLRRRTSTISDFARCCPTKTGALPAATRQRFSKRLADGRTAVYVGEVIEISFSRIGWWLAQMARLIGGPLPTAPIRMSRAS